MTALVQCHRKHLLISAPSLPITSISDRSNNSMHSTEVGIFKCARKHANNQDKKTSFNKKARNNALHQDLDNAMIKKRKFKRKKEEIDNEKKASYKFLLFFLF